MDLGIDSVALKARFQRMRRSIRMRRFVELMRLRPGMRVLDLGGAPAIWANVDIPLDITMMNIDAAVLVPSPGSPHNITRLQGDACNVTQFGDHEFDLVFSNSVIEHVGAEDKQAAFAREARRLGWSYWVQTPSRWFPIEAHCGMPLWWFYPEPLRQWFIEKWRPGLPAWTEMVEGTRVLTLGHFRSLFPDGRLYLELAYGIPKSYTVYKTDLRS